MNLSFDQFNNIFQKAKIHYPELTRTDINLTFNNSCFFTMRAKINPLSVFNKKRKYAININSRNKNILSKLSEEDICGWFGHELAHIVDYETMSNSELLVFSLRYIFDTGFRFSVERRINVYACNSGFTRELLSGWKKFCGMDGIGKRYQNYIIKNYSPHWEDIKIIAEQNGITEEAYKAIIHR